MRQQLETELKWALSAETHARLADRLDAALGAPHLLEQDNRFYDTADHRLRAARCNIRLRTENGRLLLTCKRRTTAAGPGHHHDEWEHWLDGLERDHVEAPGADLAALLPLPETIRSILAGAALLPIGGFANLRREYHHGDDLLCLDRTTLPQGRIDYELEIETARAAEAEAFWSNRLQDWGIVWQPQPLTKFARFLGCLGM
jgi:uncharacterized protein YjbK